jgi:hypothetical protein
MITPVIPNSEYTLLKHFIDAYSCNKLLQITQTAHRHKDSTYNLLGRLRNALELTTNDQWRIAKNRNDSLYFLEQVKKG